MSNNFQVGGSNFTPAPKPLDASKPAEQKPASPSAWSEANCKIKPEKGMIKEREYGPDKKAFTLDDLCRIRPGEQYLGMEH